LILGAVVVFFTTAGISVEDCLNTLDVSASTEIDDCHQLIAGTAGVQIDRVSEAVGVQDLGQTRLQATGPIADAVRGDGSEELIVNRLVALSPSWLA
jgi:hypothetical protein